MSRVDAALSPAPMTTSRLLRVYATEAKYEFVRLTRSPAFAAPAFLFPTMFYLLIGFVFGAFEHEDPNAPTYMFTGMAMMGAMTPGMFGFGVSLAMEREHGVLNLRRALPTPAAALIVGRTMMAMLAAILAFIPLAFVAVHLGKIPLGVGAVIGVGAVALLTAIPFCALGLFLGSISSASGAPAIANILYMLLIYFSNILIPLPKAIAWIALASPAFYSNQLAVSLTQAQSRLVGGVATHIGVLVAFTALCGGLAARRLARHG